MQTVRRQKRPNIHVEIQQVMDRARIFGLAEPLERAPAGIGMCGSSLVDRCFQRSYESLNGFRVRPFGAGRWHHAGSQLVYYLFSQFGILIHVCKVQDGQRHATRLQLVVVATHTELID